MKNRFRLQGFIVLICAAGILQCAQAPGPAVRTVHGPFASPVNGRFLLTPAQQYAGEVLAYMMLVVLGEAGDPGMRPEWRNRGLDVELDFSGMAAVMNNAEKDKSDLMVLDPNILGLSEVLYHYDKKLNLFKGDRVFDSIYPSVELIALRILLLQKRSRGEKINLQWLVDRLPELTDSGRRPAAEDLKTANLSAREMQLVLEVFESDASLFPYLAHPFLVDSLSSAGFIETNAFVTQARKRATYRPYRHPSCGAEKPAATIAVLPSLIAEFDPGGGGNDARHGTFSPDESYQKAVGRLEENILASVLRHARKAPGRSGQSRPYDDRAGPKRLDPEHVREKIRFVRLDQRPFVVVPQNADQSLEEICPGADIYIILLGKNVYRAIHFEGRGDPLVKKKRFYLDFLEVKYSQVSEEIDRIGRSVWAKIHAHAHEPVRR